MKRLKDGCGKHLENGKERVLEELMVKWISSGMMHEEAAHLLDSVEDTYHPNIERSRAEYLVPVQRKGTTRAPKAGGRGS